MAPGMSTWLVLLLESVYMTEQIMNKSVQLPLGKIHTVMQIVPATSEKASSNVSHFSNSYKMTHEIKPVFETDDYHE